MDDCLCRRCSTSTITTGGTADADDHPRQSIPCALPDRRSRPDAGCGSCRTFTELAPYGGVSGIELDPDAAEVARDRGAGEVRIGPLEELPWMTDTLT